MNGLPASHLGASSDEGAGVVVPSHGACLHRRYFVPRESRPLPGAVGCPESVVRCRSYAGRTDGLGPEVAASNTTPRGKRVESSVRASWFHRAPRERPFEQRAAFPLHDEIASNHGRPVLGAIAASSR